MKSIKIIGFFIVTAALMSAIFVGCEKYDDSQKNNEFTEQEIQFGITPLFSDNLKSGHELPPCSGEVPDHAEIKVVIGEEVHTFTPDVFEIDGQWYTEVFKVKIPDDDVTVTVTQFFIMDADENKIHATPKIGTPFASFVEKPLNFDFSVTGIEKIEVDIEVLCFSEKYYVDFGFYWYAFDVKEVNELYFFGDLCTKYFEDYVEEDSDGYSNLDSEFDLPAIFKVEVWDGDEWLISYDNMYMLSNGGTIDQPMAVYYPDDVDEANDIKLKLYIRLKDGNDYDWVYYETIHVDDITGDLEFPNGNLVPDYGEDGVVDFVIGECAYYESDDDPMRPDIEFAPYMNLPETADITISYPYGDMAYWEVEVHDVTPLSDGYDFGVGTYEGWCADANETITQDRRVYDVFSSLYPSLWPECDDGHIDVAVINKINHLYNFLQNNNIDYSWQGFQLAVWKLRGQTYPSSQSGVFSSYEDEANELKDDYVTLDGNYMPLPGGYAAVLLNYDCEQQLIFVQIDP